MKKLLLLLLLVATVSCQKTETILSVGVNAEYPPFEYLEKSEFVGLNVEVVQAVISNAGLSSQFKNMNFDGLMPALQSDSIDLVIGVQYTAERQKIVDFTDIYVADQQVLLIHKDNMSSWKIDNLDGLEIGVQLGTMQEQIARGIPNTETMVYQSYTGAILDLNQKKIDGVIVSKFASISYMAENPNLVILGGFPNQEKIGFAFAFNKDNKELLQTINNSLKQLMDNGEIQKIVVKYLGE